MEKSLLPFYNDDVIAALGSFTPGSTQNFGGLVSNKFTRKLNLSSFCILENTVRYEVSLIFQLTTDRISSVLLAASIYLAPYTPLVQKC